MWSFMKKVFNFKSKPEAVLEKKLHKCDSNVAIGSAADQNSDQEESSSKQGSSKQMGVFQPRFDLVDFSSQGLSCLHPIWFYKKRGDFFSTRAMLIRFLRLEKKFITKQQSISDKTLFLESSQLNFSSPKKIRQLKAGQNNKYDTAK